MRKTRLSFLACIFVAGIWMRSDPVAAYPEIQEVVSEGGIEAWLVEEHSIPVIVMEAGWEGGSGEDPPEKGGLVRLMAGLLDEGAGALDSLSFQKRLDELAVTIRFDADHDAVTARLKTLSANRDAAFDLLRLALTDPRFDAGAIERVRGQMEARIRQDEEDPGHIAARAWYRKAVPGHAYARPVEGSIESLGTISRTDIQAAYRERLAQDNLKLVVVGNITPETLKGILDRVFGGLPRQSRSSVVEEVQVTLAPALEIVERANPQSVVVFGHNGFKRDDTDFLPAYVMNYILGGGGFSSRLMTEIREKRGLAYSVTSYLYPRRHAGFFIGQVATANERVRESVDLIRLELLRLVQEGISKQELTDARTYLTGSYPLRFDTNEKIAGQLLAMRLNGIEREYVAQRNALVNALTMEDINRVIRRLMDPENLIVTIVGQPEGFQKPSPESAGQPVTRP